MIMSISFLKYNAINNIFFGIFKWIQATQQKDVQTRKLKYEQKESTTLPIVRHLKEMTLSASLAVCVTCRITRP